MRPTRMLSPAESRALDAEVESLMVGSRELFHSDGWLVEVEGIGSHTLYRENRCIPVTGELDEDADPEEGDTPLMLESKVLELTGERFVRAFTPRLRGWWGKLPSGIYAYAHDAEDVAYAVARARIDEGWEYEQEMRG